MERDEVILLAGCTPPAAASRYFAATPYLFSAYSNETRRWVNVFASMGDSFSIHTPLAGNATAGGVIAVQAALAQAMQGAAAARGDAAEAAALHSTKSAGPARMRLRASLPAGGSPGLLSRLSRLYDQLTLTPLRGDTASPSLTQLVRSVDGSGSNDASASTRASAPASGGGSVAAEDDDVSSFSSAAGSPARPQRFDAFSIVLMSASPSATAAVLRTLAPALAAAGFSEPFSNIVNVVAIPEGPFSAEIGLDTYSAYYSLMLRNIVPSGRSGEFMQYLKSQPLAAFRISRARGDEPGVLAASVVGELLSSGLQLLPGVDQASPVAGSDQNLSQSTALSLADLGIGVAPPSSLNATDGIGDGSSRPGSSSVVEYDGMRNYINSSQANGTIGGDAVSSMVDIIKGSSSSDSSRTGSSDGSAHRLAELPSTLKDVFQAVPLIPRRDPSGRSERWLAPALEALLSSVERSQGQQNAITYSIGSTEVLSLVGIDSGADCLDKRIDFCNGDNRWVHVADRRTNTEWLLCLCSTYSCIRFTPAQHLIAIWAAISRQTIASRTQ